MTIGYVNNVGLKVGIVPSDELENIARKLGNPAFTSMVDSEDWKGTKGTFVKASGNPRTYKNPYAKSVRNKMGDDGKKVVGDDGKPVKETIYSKVYSIKGFTVQWGNIKNKSDKDSEVKAAYDKHGLEWGVDGAIDPNDKRGQGWKTTDDLKGTPFQKHDTTKNIRLAMYSKKEGVKHGKSKYFLNYKGDIAELTPDELEYLWTISPKSSYEKPMPKRLAMLANQEAAQEIFNLENSYDFKNLNLNKIVYINCSMRIDGEIKKFTYVNKNAAPDGLDAGEFNQFIS
jgi:hypothetical protein